MGSFPALISGNPPAPAQVEVLVVWARVASVSGLSWEIQGTPSPSFSLNFKWRKSPIIWKWRDLNRQPSGKLNWEVETKHVRLVIACVMIVCCKVHLWLMCVSCDVSGDLSEV